jgi:hypothetical protein
MLGAQVKSSNIVRGFWGVAPVKNLIRGNTGYSVSGEESGLSRWSAKIPKKGFSYLIQREKNSQSPKTETVQLEKSTCIEG